MKGGEGHRRAVLYHSGSPSYNPTHFLQTSIPLHSHALASAIQGPSCLTPEVQVAIPTQGATLSFTKLQPFSPPSYSDANSTQNAVGSDVATKFNAGTGGAEACYGAPQSGFIQQVVPSLMTHQIVAPVNVSTGALVGAGGNGGYSHGGVGSQHWSLSAAPSMVPSSLNTSPVYLVLQSAPGVERAPAQPSLGANDVPSRHCNGMMYELGGWYEGVVKRYNPMRGFGFLTATHHLRVVPSGRSPCSTREKGCSAGDGSSMGDNSGKPDTYPRLVSTPVTVGDVFVHQSYIQMQGFRALSIGDRVVFRIGVLDGKKAHQAVSVQRISGAKGKEMDGRLLVGKEEAPAQVALPKRSVDQKSKPEHHSPHEQERMQLLLSHVTMSGSTNDITPDHVSKRMQNVDGGEDDFVSKIAPSPDDHYSCSDLIPPYCDGGFDHSSIFDRDVNPGPHTPEVTGHSTD
ncbi:hypothetical protein TRVL_05763 [Trypanosoma vivax]|nr:hypothetical protein TRVL_05763 [Trypanosoma vivax]